nr:transposase [Ligilactobacillus ruminis]
MWNCETIEDARKKRDEIIADYRDVAEAAMSCLDEGFESSMTVMALPKNLRRYFRTSNHIERLNKELKRRSSVIGIFPNKNSLMRLMGSVLLERNDVVISKKAIFSPVTYAKMIKSETVAELKKLAEEQQKLRAA